jgi:putative RecB family exonuclease
VHLSYSKIAAYRQCPQRYRLTYINRVPRPPIPHMAFARRVHTVLHGFHALAGQRRIQWEELLQEYRMSFRETGELHPEDAPEFRDGAEILKGYFEANQHIRQAPALLEYRFRVDLFPTVLTGALDRVEVAPTGYEIIDYKISRRLPEQHEVEGSLQLRLYHLALRETQGLRAERVGFYYLRQNRFLATEVSSSQEKETVELVRETDATIRQDREFTPCVGTWCGGCPVARYCSARTPDPLPVAPANRQMALF